MANSRVALIGLGVMGMNHLKTLKKIENVNLVGVADKNKIEGLSVPFYHDYHELLEQKPDGVIIATPTSTHKKIAMECLEKNIPVLIEKPVASSVTEARELLQAFKSNPNSISAHVGYSERFNPAVVTLRKELQNLEPIKVQITRVGPYPKRITDVGILCDLSVHDLDLLRYLCDDELISHSIYEAKTKHRYEDSALIHGKMAKGTIFAISTSWLSPLRRREMNVYTKDFYFKVDLLQKRVWKYPIDGKNPEEGGLELAVQAVQPLETELKEWLSFLQSKNSCRLATIQDSLKTLEFISQSSAFKPLGSSYPKAKLEEPSLDSQRPIL